MSDNKSAPAELDDAGQQRNTPVDNSPQLLLGFETSFSKKFIREYAGHIITDPRIAITELIANAYDAGARSVDIQWPVEPGAVFSITDDGTGMTVTEFWERWRELSYDRLAIQGNEVEFPPGRGRRQRTPFGRNGKGRLAAFYFDDQYTIATTKSGICTRATVRLTEGGKKPFEVVDLTTESASSHGTTISAVCLRSTISVAELREMVGARFLVDPEFSISVNGQKVEFLDLKALNSETINIEPYGLIEVKWIDAPAHDRKNRLRGITYWVGARMVGEPSWHGLDRDGSILDGRKNEAKRLCFVVMADILRDDVMDDWGRFQSAKRPQDVQDGVKKWVVQKLLELTASDRKERKRSALIENRQIVEQISSYSRRLLSQFVDRVLESCKLLSEADLVRTVEIYAKLEQARSGYDILKRLEECTPDDLDTWNGLMEQWQARHAQLVLDELGKRISLIRDLEALVNDPKTDEVHQLQPLFERGLWMFGPEYEAVDFRANRSMARVIKSFFGVQADNSSTNRMDIVSVSGSTITPYSADSFDAAGEVFGCRKVLIVELKRGGKRITQAEVDQARNYADELRRDGAITRETPVEAWILGSTIDPFLEPLQQGKTCATACSYDALLRRAKARTFFLQQRINEIAPAAEADPDMDEVTAPSAPTLF